MVSGVGGVGELIAQAGNCGLEGEFLVDGQRIEGRDRQGCGPVMGCSGDR